nr:hepatoma derived growth factor protein [Hymenolepis microstoma]
MSYVPRDRVFAKVRGHPHWPARINIVPEGSFIPKGKHPIFFYGTHEVYSLAPKDLYPYEQWKHKYGVPKKNNPLFQRGLEEIENNPDVLLLGTDPAAEDFLSQFYPKKSSKPSSPKIRSCKPDDSSESLKPSQNSQDPCLIDLDATPDQSITDSLPAKRTPKRSVRKSTSTSSVTKRSKQTCTAPGSNSIEGNSGKKEELCDDVCGQVMDGSEVRKEKGVKMLNHSSMNLSPHNLPATTSTGRPMRKSAAKFLHAKPYKYPPLGLTSDESLFDKDLDWKSSSAASNRAKVPSISKTDEAKPQKIEDASTEKPTKEENSEEPPEVKVITKRSPLPYSPSSTPLSSPSRDDREEETSRRKRKASGERTERKRVRLSSISSSQRPNRKSLTSPAEKPRMKVSNVSMTPEELNARLNSRLNAQNGTKQLNELDTEAKLHQCYLGIKKSLIRGQENLSACIQRMEIVEKLPITLPILVKCFPIIETIKKCTRYTRSDGVKIGALRLHNKFLSIFENATKEEKREAQTALAEVRQNSSNQGGPATVEAIFANKDSSSNSTSTQQSDQTPSSRSAEAEKPHPAPPTSLEPVQHSPHIHPPVDLPPALSPLPTSYQDAPLSPSALIKSDSEGLAVSDNESPRSDLCFQRSLPHHPSSGEIISAARRAFYQHTTNRVGHTQPPVVAISPSQPDSYEPQPLYTSSQPLPTYNPFHGEIVEELPPPVQNVSENRRPRVPGRERPRSPHALPHPLEHYQRFLNNGEPQQPQSRQSFPQPSQPSVDLDSRIAQLLGHSHQRGEEQHHFVENPLPNSQQYHQAPQPHPTPLPPIDVLSSSHSSLQRPSSQNIVRGSYGLPPMKPQHLMGPQIPPPQSIIYPSMPPHHSAYPPAQMMAVGPSVPSQHLYPQPQSMASAPDDSQQWPHTQLRYHGAPGPDDLYRQQGGGSDSGPH